jgi:hypothetical protein
MALLSTFCLLFAVWARFYISKFGFNSRSWDIGIVFAMLVHFPSFDLSSPEGTNFSISKA